MDEGSSTPYGQDSPPPGGPPPGYGAPPPPNYPPPGGYAGPPPGGYGAPGGYSAGTPTSDDRTWAMLSHLSYFVLSLIGPIIIMLTKGKESAFVRDQAVEALNFHITLAIASIVSFILIFVIIGIFLLAAVIIAGAVLAIMGAIAAYNGTAYRYPLILRLVK
jgi:uncharacterized Tic20 family protein